MIRLAAVIVIAVMTAVSSNAENEILANTREMTREAGANGYGKAIHGRFHILGHAYPFVSGGQGRGSIPFGVYHVGNLSWFEGRKGHHVPAFALSDVYDPFAKDTRSGLYIHPGRRASRGCLAIYPTFWAPFVQDMSHFVGRLLFLGHKQLEPPWTEPIQTAKRHVKVIKTAMHRRHKKGIKSVSKFQRSVSTRLRHRAKR